MLMSIALTLHILAFTVWIGGMFFAHQALRGAAAITLEPPIRLRLWRATFARFFPWVWLCIIIILVTGFWMMFQFPKPPIFVHIMMGLGLIMVLMFLHVFFAPYNRLKKAQKEEDWESGAKALGQMRMLIGINLSIGLITIVVATAGKFFIN